MASDDAFGGGDGGGGADSGGVGLAAEMVKRDRRRIAPQPRFQQRRWQRQWSRWTGVPWTRRRGLPDIVTAGLGVEPVGLAAEMVK